MNGNTVICNGDLITRAYCAAGEHAKSGRNRVFVCCSNPDCHHNAELDVGRLLDDVTFNDLQPRMLCPMCDHRSADVRPPWWRHG
jgi:hypothetical protein